MPLDAEAEPGGGIFDRFDDAVGSGGGHLKALGYAFHRLMVPAVHLARVGIAQTLAHQLPEQRVLVDPDLVRQRVRLVRRPVEVVRQRARHLRWNVLDEGAAARDVQHLDAAADREDRKVARAGIFDERQLEFVTARLRLDQRRVRRLPVSRRRHIVAAREHESVDAGERLLHGHRRIEHAHLAADVENRLAVVLELATGGDSDQRHM